MARVKSVNGSFHYSVFMLVFFIAAYTGFFSYLSVLKYKAFFSLAGDDLAISNNILWHSAKGNFFYQSIGEHLLDFHAGFFYFFLSAAYRLYPHIPTLFVFDEPTTGLHFEDIRVLMNVINKLVDRGNSVIIIEHNMDVIKLADHIIDIGPDGGRNGGHIIATGTPEEIAQNTKSYTGEFLKKELALGLLRNNTVTI